MFVTNPLTRLIIARHGNTFTRDQTPTRIGRRTDLDLVEEKRSRAIGHYLIENNLLPAKVFAAPLKRTTNTARLAVNQMQTHLSIEPEESFLEIDYGPDENQTEDQVLQRLGGLRAVEMGQNLEQLSNQQVMAIGREVINAWNRKATVPGGWKVNPADIVNNWHRFAKKVEMEYPGQTVLLVTSNGIARFSPHLTGEFASFAQKNQIKLTTGGLAIFEKQSHQQHWKCTAWNIPPCRKFCVEY